MWGWGQAWEMPGSGTGWVWAERRLAAGEWHCHLELCLHAQSPNGPVGLWGKARNNSIFSTLMQLRPEDSVHCGCESERPGPSSGISDPLISLPDVDSRKHGELTKLCRCSRGPLRGPLGHTAQ